MRYFVLQGHDAVEVPEKGTWQDWMRSHVKDRIVERTKLGREYHVVTLFTGRSEKADELPEIFSTAVFSWWSADATATFRWRTWLEAESGHERIAQRVALRLAVEREHGGYPCK